MATEFDIPEVEAAFRAYWQAGMIREDWDAWVDCFTEDVVYHERMLGDMYGREAVRAWIKPLMEEYTSIYGVYEWHSVHPSGRVVFYMQNRRDRPGGGAPLDFPGITVLQYAGEGRFCMEEDYWAMKLALSAKKTYDRLAQEHDPTHPARRTRLAWDLNPERPGPEWTRGPASYWEHPHHAGRKPRDV